MSTTFIVLLFGITLYYIYSVAKRVTNLEQKQGAGYTWAFNINVIQAVLSNPHFGNLTGIKSAKEGKQFKDWNEGDRKIWHDKFSSLVSEKCFLRLTYLSSEDCFFLKNKTTSGIVLKDIGKTLLYSEIVAGDIDGFEDHLTFDVYERVKKDDGYQRVITLCLEERFKGYNKKPITHILLDFPYQRSDMDDEKFKQMGFDVKRREGDYLGEDIFGDHSVFPDYVTLTKNNAEISF